jgi:PEP-CTERM motif-containing protein
LKHLKKLISFSGGYMTNLQADLCRRITTLMIIILVSAACVGTSHAVTVYHLTNTNVPGVTADIEVTVSDGCSGAGACTVTVDYISSTITNTVKEISAIGMNTATFNVAVSDSNPSGWTGGSCPTSGGNPGCGGYDGFGKFKSEANSNAAESEDFTLTLADTTFSPNSTGANFAVHVQFFGVNGGSCSIFASDGTSGQTSSLESGCTTSQVPEPSTFLLFGAGLILVGYCRPKLFARSQS